jgi:hypothetical protein
MAGTTAGTKRETPNILANAVRPKVTPKRASPEATKAGTKGEGASCVAYFQIPICIPVSLPSAIRFLMAGELPLAILQKLKIYK